MGNSAKRVARFALLEQLQKTKVEQAGQRYQAGLKASAAANEKLASLEAYFGADTPEPQHAVYAVNLVELNVFRSRLRDAIAAQRTVCDQFRQQCELLRKQLVNAQERSSGLGKARSKAQSTLEQLAEKKEQQLSEDAVIARYYRQQ